MERKRQAIMPYERVIIREDKKSDNPFRDYVRKQRLKKLKPIGAVLILICIWYVLIGKDILPVFMSDVMTRSKQEVSVKYDETLCSEANLARMIVLTCKGQVEESEQVDQTLWYEKYYTALEEMNITCIKKEDAFNLIKYNQLYQIFSESFGKSVADLIIKEKESYYIYEVIGYLEEALAKSGKGKMTICENVILATPSDDVLLQGWQVMTSEGNLSFEGLVVAPLKNKTVTLAVCNQHILGVMSIDNEQCMIKACTITKVDELEGLVSYEVNNQLFTYANTILTKEQEGRTLNLVLSEDKIVDYEAATSEGAASLTQTANKLNIRVLISDASGNYKQDNVSLVGDGDYDLIYQERASDFLKGSVWTAEQFEWQVGETVRFVPRVDSKLALQSIIKAGSSPQYKGIIEITKTSEGYVIVNEVDMEEYIAGVIPSEMPTSYGKEALKAQAVAARTYATASLGSTKFSEYNADVDDTTSSQVYNRIPADEASYTAAQETAGLVLKSNNQFISNKFFATSCGYTANSNEVWLSSNSSPSYLSVSKQYEDDLTIKDMQQENEFKAFIRLSAEDLNAYDEASPWFRWHVDLSKSNLEALMIPVIKELSEKESQYITYEKTNGQSTKEPISDIGGIKKVEIRKRGEGGNAMEMAVYGTKGTAIISSEYYIRSLFASNSQADLTVTRADDSTISNLTLLPSAFFYIEEERNKETGELTHVTLYGGGNGHGVGLSQDGAKGMAEMGYDYKEILAHYYRGTQLVNAWQ